MKEHERIFFALCYNLRNMFSPRSIIVLLSGTLPDKQCCYYLKKWSRLGFYDYGVTLDLGWFEPAKIPPRYSEIVSNQVTIYSTSGDKLKMEHRAMEGKL